MKIKCQNRNPIFYRGYQNIFISVCHSKNCVLYQSKKNDRSYKRSFCGKVIILKSSEKNSIFFKKRNLFLRKRKKKNSRKKERKRNYIWSKLLNCVNQINILFPAENCIKIFLLYLLYSVY